MPARPSAASRLAVTAAVTIVLLAGCARDDSPSGSSSEPTERPTTTTEPVIDPGDGGDYAPEIDPADFVPAIDNPYLPYPVGARWTYDGTSDGEEEHVEVTVLAETKVVMGVEATVVRDTVTVDGELVEDTYDWFAQDAEGNVWYFGEDVKDYEDGKVVSTAGSWEAGVDGALPGIVMPAEPAVGGAFRQEFLPGEAEDLFEVLEVDGTASTPLGDFTEVVVTEDWNPLEPDVVEHKSYARGRGLVLEETVAGGEGRIELTAFEPGAQG